jgi:hypothetical protein
MNLQKGLGKGEGENNGVVAKMYRYTSAVPESLVI